MNSKWKENNSNNNNLLQPYVFLRAILIEDRVESKRLCLACTILNLHEKTKKSYLHYTHLYFHDSFVPRQI